MKKNWDVDATLVDVNNTNNVESVAGTNSWTNVAAYELADELISLDTAYNAVYNRQNKLVAMTDYVALANKVEKGQKHFAITDAHDGEYINVTQNTVIFYVLGTAADKIDTVDVVVGYKNIVPVTGINAVYAVADRTNIDTEYDDYYWEAQILVIEAKDYEVSYKDALAFVYSNPEKETTKVFSLESIAADGTLDVLYVENDFFAGQYVSDSVNPLAFYPTYEDEDGFDVLKGEITENYAKKNIFAGEFKRYQESAKMDYIDVIIDGEVVSVDMPADAVAYTLSTGKGGTYDAAELDLAERTNKGDKIIYVTDKDGEIVYIIDVDASFVADATDSAIVAANKAAASETLTALWQDIVDEATATPATEEIDYAGEATALIGDGLTAETIEAAKELLALATAEAAKTDITVAEQKNAQDAVDALTTAIDNYETDVALEEARAAVLALIDEKTAEGGEFETWTPGMIAAAKAAVENSTTPAESIATTAAGEVKVAQNAAIDAINAKVDGLTKADYNTDEWNDIGEIAAKAIDDIKDATTTDAITTLKTDALTAIDDVLTAAEKTALTTAQTKVAAAKATLAACTQSAPLAVQDDYSAAKISDAIDGKINDAAVTATHNVTTTLDAAADGGSVTVTLKAGSGASEVTDTVTIWVKLAI